MGHSVGLPALAGRKHRLPGMSPPELNVGRTTGRNHPIFAGRFRARSPERRTGERHFSLLRVGSLTIDGRRELCLIKNISAGGMLIRAYCDIAAGTRISIELKHGEPIVATAKWTRDEYVGVSFDQPIDILALLASSEHGPRPRMPRVEVDCMAWVRVGSLVHRTRAVDISQGGIKIEFRGALPAMAEVVVSLTGLDPCHGVFAGVPTEHGITFNRVIALPVLVSWLQDGRAGRAAGLIIPELPAGEKPPIFDHFALLRRQRTAGEARAAEFALIRRPGAAHCAALLPLQRPRESDAGKRPGPRSSGSGGAVRCAEKGRRPSSGRRSPSISAPSSDRLRSFTGLAPVDLDAAVRYTAIVASGGLAVAALIHFGTIAQRE